MVCSTERQKTHSTNVFQKMLETSEGPKPNKTWVYIGSEFYNRSIKPWL